MAFRTESGTDHSRYQLLAVEQGFQRDYDHIDMLTHSACPNDIFPHVTRWLNSHTT